jgi:hypothetical protein
MQPQIWKMSEWEESHIVAGGVNLMHPFGIVALTGVLGKALAAKKMSP